MSVNSGTQKIQVANITTSHFFHYFDVALLKTDAWHFLIFYYLNCITQLPKIAVFFLTKNTMKNLSDAGLKPLWPGLASIALHAHPVVPQHRGKRPLARRLQDGL